MASAPAPDDNRRRRHCASVAPLARCLDVATIHRGLILAARPCEDELSLMAGSPAPQALPVANTPLIAHSLETIASSGSTEVGIVISAETSADVRAAVEALTADGALGGLEVTYLDCKTPPTLPAALVEAREFLDGGRFVVQLGDSFVLPPVTPLEDEASGGDDDATLYVRRTSEPQRRDGAPLGKSRRLHLVGDPPPPPPDQALAGIFAFGPGAIEASAELVAGDGSSSPQVSDLLAALRARGGELALRPVRDSWKYSGEVDELLAANRMVLDDLQPDQIEIDLSSAQIEGRVAIHRTAVLERTTVRGPAVIGPGAVLLDTFVGPYTAIGENVRVEGAELEYSIVLPGASIRHPGSRLEASLVGQGARISRDFSLPSSLRLRVGSRAEISLS